MPGKVDLPLVSVRELAAADGLDGRPAWVAVSGLVYDVTHLFLWKGGSHFVRHAAGRDLTEELLDAPHGIEIMGRSRLVGRLDS